MVARTMMAFRGNALSGLLAGVALLALLVGTGRGDSVSELRLAAGRYEQDVLRWELTHFLDKWVNLAATRVFGRSLAEAERREAIEEFFALGEELRASRDELEQTLALEANGHARSPAAVQQDIGLIEASRDELRTLVEEAMEAAISNVVDELGIIDRIGPVRWPPVDFAFEQNALVLVRSPRDRIERLTDLLIQPHVSILKQVRLEEHIETRQDNVSALVMRVGGIATYPAQVTPNGSLHATLFLASHEWLHHWLFFRPLGWRWFEGGELTSINETTANIFGEEVGDLALTRLTGEVFQREPWQPPTLRAREEPPPDVFDFRREMQATRVRLEELLVAGQVDEAEAYLDERRVEFVANGSNIRKLNNAWFAFRGTYADSPASISPIEEQLRTVRAGSVDLAEFLDRIAPITRPGQLEVMAREAGWKAAERGT